MSAPTREVILGVGGGIAAYKACDLLRRLQDAHFAVTVVPTPSSLNFVGRATWEALSGRLVTTDVFEAVDQVRHIALAKSAQALIIAPATADLIARIAAGRADDLLTNLVLATTSPILIVPAMHPAMWFNEATQANITILRARGFDVLEPVEGPLTSGDIGKGRFPTTEEIIDRFTTSTLRDLDLVGKKVLISAGGTREAIDPVRYIGNRSTGKQGIALAEVALARGAAVTLVIANSSLHTNPRIKRIDVESVSQMHNALNQEFDRSDLLFMAAAISDVRVSEVSPIKIKKSNLHSISLSENIDILTELAAKRVKQVLIAFAAETDSPTVSDAQDKMRRKGADLIYLNDVSHGAIFGAELTTGTIIDSNGVLGEFRDAPKEIVAEGLINHALQLAHKLR